MAAIGSVWAPATWDVDAWQLDTWADATAPVVSTKATSPTRLSIALDTHDLAVVGLVPTQLHYEPLATGLTFYSDDGLTMATPLTFTAGETGNVTLELKGADGRPQDLTGATATWTLMNLNGTVTANAVSLTVVTASAGTARWNRLLAEINTPGDYLGQAKATLADGTFVYFPDAKGTIEGYSGYPVTLLRAVGT